MIRLAAQSLIVVCLIAVILIGVALETVRGRENLRLNTFTVNASVGDPAAGEYVAISAGCIGCHTKAEGEGDLLAGGVAIKTPFGTFYTPNITRDPEHGIGDWTLKQFAHSIVLGITPAGEHHFPAYPYTAYSGLTDQDIVNLKSWLDTVQPVSSPSRPHELAWPLSSRRLLVLWKALFFRPQTVANETRGRYLVEGPGHCAECHASRNRLGGIPDRRLNGNTRGPDAQPVPGITVSQLTDWTVEDLELFLEVGITPSGDFAGGHMVDVIEQSTSLLTAEDRLTIAQFLLSENNQ